VNPSDIQCTVLIENHPGDIEQWDITIDFVLPKPGQMKFTLPARYAIRDWLKWRSKSSLSLVPDEMIGSPNFAAGFLLKKASDLGITPLLEDTPKLES
jgi:hypothetical protein